MWTNLAVDILEEFTSQSAAVGDLPVRFRFTEEPLPTVEDFPALEHEARKIPRYHERTRATTLANGRPGKPNGMWRMSEDAYRRKKEMKRQRYVKRSRVGSCETCGNTFVCATLQKRFCNWSCAEKKRREKEMDSTRNLGNPGSTTEPG